MKSCFNSSFNGDECGAVSLPSPSLSSFILSDFCRISAISTVKTIILTDVFCHNLGHWKLLGSGSCVLWHDSIHLEASLTSGIIRGPSTTLYSPWPTSQMHQFSEGKVLEALESLGDCSDRVKLLLSHFSGLSHIFKTHDSVLMSAMQSQHKALLLLFFLLYVLTFTKILLYWVNILRYLLPYPVV